MFDKLEIVIADGHFLDSLVKKCLDSRPKFRPRNIDKLLERETTGIIRKGGGQHEVELLVKLQELQVFTHGTVPYKVKPWLGGPYIAHLKFMILYSSLGEAHRVLKPLPLGCRN